MAKIKSVVNTKTGKLAMVLTKDRKTAIDTIKKEYGVKASQIIGAHSQRDFSSHTTYYMVTWRN